MSGYLFLPLGTWSRTGYRRKDRRVITARSDKTGNLGIKIISFLGPGFPPVVVLSFVFWTEDVFGGGDRMSIRWARPLAPGWARTCRHPLMCHSSLRHLYLILLHKLRLPQRLYSSAPPAQERSSSAASSPSSASAHHPGDLHHLSGPEVGIQCSNPRHPCGFHT